MVSFIAGITFLSFFSIALVTFIAGYLATGTSMTSSSSLLLEYSETVFSSSSKIAGVSGTKGAATGDDATMESTAAAVAMTGTGDSARMVFGS
jgi:hypothetical protein